MEEIFAYLNSIHPIHLETKDYLLENLTPMEVPRKKLILRQGHICRNIYFISRGLLRCYYLREGKEICSWFMKEGDVIISVESFFNQKESKENIQALEESFLYFLSYEELQFAYKHFADFNSIGRILTEKYYQLCEQRLYSLRMQKAHEKYQFLMKHFPQIIQRVPLKDIASYLGITIETLSRIRALKY
jgi:CRP-like cAMP-binding protein